MYSLMLKQKLEHIYVKAAMEIICLILRQVL